MRQPPIAGIIGLGMLGASFALAIQATGIFTEVWGFDTSPAMRDRAMQAQAITVACPDLETLLRGVDVVVLATPVRAIIQILTSNAASFRPGTLVMDLGSTKAQIVAAMDALPTTLEAIGGHPMTGPVSAHQIDIGADLFRDHPFVLTPTTLTHPEALTWWQLLLEKIGARVIVMDAAAHDRVVAIISHLPRFLPIALLALADQDVDPMPFALAAGGFQESTRKVTDNIEMWLDVALTNPVGITNAIAALQQALENLASTIASGDADAIRGTLTHAQQIWLTHFGAK